MFNIWYFLLRGLQISAPIAYGALGGVYSETGGVVNIAIEGMMLSGTFFYVWGAKTTGNWFIGLLAAILGSVLLALIHGVVTITFKVDHVVSGTAINILAAGLTRFLCMQAFGMETQSPVNPYVPPTVFGINVLAFFFIPLALFTIWLFKRTRFGLRLRSCGQNPWAADSLGVNVYMYKYIGVILSGVFAGLAAATLYPNQWIDAMTAGRGYIALAAMIFGNYNALNAALASMLFGYAETLTYFQEQIPLLSNISPILIKTFPYVLALIVLAGFIGKTKAPKADGVVFEKGED
ncbi:ABC transporter permease [Coprothermobacter platensis]|uniref:ABC transporter permease n=1 Tax=Coprothermobacter platensis TaxID=108819 RepID=UPI0003635D33|nr:ABC transporter permease [Coprothermobacter platensis]